MDNNEEPKQGEGMSKAMLIAMAAIVVAMALLSIYANWQNAHRDRIESTIVTRFTPTPTPRPSATP
jgi:hypothetical protein